MKELTLLLNCLLKSKYVLLDVERELSWDLTVYIDIDASAGLKVVTNIFFVIHANRQLFDKNITSAPY